MPAAATATEAQVAVFAREVTRLQRENARLRAELSQLQAQAGYVSMIVASESTQGPRHESKAA